MGWWLLRLSGPGCHLSTPSVKCQGKDHDQLGHNWGLAERGQLCHPQHVRVSFRSRSSLSLTTSETLMSLPDPTRTLPPLPDAGLVRLRLVITGSFLQAPFGPLTLPDPTITVETSVPDLAPLEHHWRHTSSSNGWSQLAGLQPAGERIAGGAGIAYRAAAEYVCCSSPVGLRLF